MTTGLPKVKAAVGERVVDPPIGSIVRLTPHAIPSACRSIRTCAGIPTWSVLIMTMAGPSAEVAAVLGRDS